VVDCLNFKDLVERHRGLETIVVFDVLGSDTLIRAPRNIYDSWVLSMIIPLVKTAEDNLDLFALKHNNGWRKSEGAKLHGRYSGGKPVLQQLRRSTARPLPRMRPQQCRGF
jgi:hypothetical protein